MTVAATARRSPGRPRLLSEEEVVDAACALMRERGLDGLSMRSLARALGVPPMTVYGYVSSRQELEALLADRILREVRVPGPAAGRWDVRLHRLLCDARRMLVERPEVAAANAAPDRDALRLLERGAYGREAARLRDGVLDLLHLGGFSGDHVHLCFVTLFTFVTGQADGDDGEIFSLGLEALIDGLELRFGPGGRAR